MVTSPIGSLVREFEQKVRGVISKFIFQAAASRNQAVAIRRVPISGRNRH